MARSRSIGERRSPSRGATGTGPPNRRTLTIIVLTAAITAVFAVTAMAASSTFFDVQAGDTHEPVIDFMLEAGVTLGCAANAYCPEDPVTRAQMATFMHCLSVSAAAATCPQQRCRPRTMGNQPGSRTSGTGSARPAIAS